MKIKLFNEKHINQIFQDIYRKSVNGVENLNERELLNNIDELTNRIFEPLKENHLEVDFTEKEANVEMAQVSGNRFSLSADVNRNGSYSCANVIFTFKIISNSKFLRALPTHHQFEYVNATIDNNKLHLNYQTLYGNIKLSDNIKNEVKNWIVNLIPKMETTITLINNEITEFNDGLKIKIKENISEKINKMTDRNQQNEDLTDF